MKSRFINMLVALGVLAAIPTTVIAADTLFNSQPLRSAITTQGLQEHLQALQDIYTNNGNHREFGTTGYTQTLDYIQQHLAATNYYNIYRKTYTFPFFTNLGPPELQQISPVPTTYVSGTDMRTGNFSGNGEVTAEVVPVDVVVPATGLPGSAFSSGCTASDFASINVTNKIALMQRGTCAFLTKVTNAINAGAIGVLIFNVGNTPANLPAFAPDTAQPVSVPVIGTSYALGADIVNKVRNGDTVIMRMKTNTISENRTGEYIVADTKKGDPNQVILLMTTPDASVGSPSISTGGTGVAANLEIAEQLPNVAPPLKTVRFLFANGGANVAYRDSLSAADYQKIIAAIGVSNLGALNNVIGVMDGDFSSTIDISPSPNGSGLIESAYLEYFKSINQVTEPLPSGNIIGMQPWSLFRAPLKPIGGLNTTGTSATKTAQEASVFGGTAGVAYNVNANTANDTLSNVNLNLLKIMTDAQAHAIYTLMRTKADIVDDATLKPGKGNDYVLPGVGICGDVLSCSIDN